MDPEIKLTSAAEAAEAPETEVTSAVEAPETEVASAPEAPETDKVASAAEAPETEVASAAEAPETEVASAAEVQETEVASAPEAPEIEVASAAKAPKIEVASAAKGLNVGGTSVVVSLEVGETSSAGKRRAWGTEIDGKDSIFSRASGGISAAGDLEVGGTSSAEELKTEVERYWRYDSTSSSDSIFRAPAHIRYGRESDFEPKLVSIGPYYRGRPNLKQTEDTKVRCMSNLLMMRPGDETKGEDKFGFYNKSGASNIDHMPVDLFLKFETSARSFYKEKFDQISDVEFVQMLLLDSCFVIQILLSLCGAIPKSMGSLEVNMKEVRSDLLLLENQIPLFFIHEVYNWLFPYEHTFQITHVLKWFIERDLPWEVSSNCLDFESDHLLDFYWKSSVPNTEELIKIMKSGMQRQTLNWAHTDRSLPKLIANATELHQIARINFGIDYNYQGLRVEFSNGIMRMRCLKIDSSLATLLVNLIAYENSMPSSLRIISTYIKILDDLIDSEKDVELLQKFVVIYNTLSSHTMAATFFNDIGNLCLIEHYDNPFAGLFSNVEKYYKSSWNRRWASLRNNYFNSPWAGISVFAGVLLLFLAAVQTYYTVFPRK